MIQPLTLQEQFLLLCLNDDTGRFEGMWVAYGLNGAGLADLFLRRRIGLDEKQRVIIQDASATGDDLLDRALARIAQSRRVGRLSGWAGSLYRGRPTAAPAL